MKVSRGELLGFIGLVLGLSWLQFVPPLLKGIADVELPAYIRTALIVVFFFSPSIAALLLVGRQATAEDAVSFLRRRLRWRVSLGWYLVALFLLPVIVCSALIAFILQGGSVPTLDTQALVLISQVFTIGVVANLVENYGWRGYLQEGLQSAYSAFTASLVVGIVWGLWHAPVFLLSNTPQSAIPYGGYLVMIVGLAVIFGWVYNETGGSVLLVTLMHCTFNASTGPIFFSLIEAGGDVRTFTALSTAVVWVAVVVILLRTSSKTLTGSRCQISKR